MKKNIKKLIKEDFQKSYSCGYNKEEVLQNFVVKEKDKELIHTTKRKLILQYCLIGILGILMGMTATALKESLLCENQVITQEFKKYLKEEGYRGMNPDARYIITVGDEMTVYIYLFNNINKKDYNYYYYFVKTTSNKKYDLKISNRTYEIENNSHGLLTVIEKQEEKQELEFSIEINGKVKKYVLN